MSRIPIQFLNALVAFGNARNLVEAAATLGISQPALSKQLKALEKLVDQPLFSHRGRKKVMTPFGTSLHAMIQGRIGGLDQIVDEANSLHLDAKRARLSIIARRGILDRLSARVRFSGFLNLLEASNDEIMDGLLTHRAQIGITHSRPDSSELIAMPLFRERFRVAVPKRILPNSKAHGRSLARELVNLPCVGFKMEDELLNHFCALNSIPTGQLRMSRATANYSSIAFMVEAGMGWAVLPSYLELDASRVWTVPLRDESSPDRRFFLLYRKEFARIPWFKELLGEITSCFRG